MNEEEFADFRKEVGRCLDELNAALKSRITSDLKNSVQPMIIDDEIKLVFSHDALGISLK